MDFFFQTHLLNELESFFRHRRNWNRSQETIINNSRVFSFRGPVHRVFNHLRGLYRLNINGERPSYNILSKYT